MSDEEDEEVGIGLESDDDDNDDANSNAPPPAANPSASIASGTLRQSSLWGRDPPPQAATGRGGGRGGANANASAPSRFERLSALGMELELRERDDGGASSLFSEDMKYQKDVLSSKRKGKSDKRKQRSASALSNDGCASNADQVEKVSSDDDDFEDEEEEGEGEEEERKKRKRKKKEGRSADFASAAMASASLGGNRFAGAFDSDSDCSLDDASVDSSVVRRARKKAFPISGVTCVGCALAQKIEPVEDFVVKNCSRMTSDSLWKHAALVWKLEVVDKAKNEHSYVPDWSWKNIRSHFLVHSSHPVLNRQMTISQLQLMRMSLENRMLRVAEDGSRDVDRGNAELLLKIAKQESQERTILNSLLASSSSAAAAAAASGGRGGVTGKHGASGGPTVG